MPKHAHLLSPAWKDLVRQWLLEDIPSFDRGGFVVGEAERTALLWGKTDGVLAGVPFFEEIFRILDCSVEWLLDEGEAFSAVKKVAVVRGKARNILMGERTALDVLSRASGIASRARRLVRLACEKGWQGRVAATRKTTPGFRLVEKYAVVVGGADTHRMDLSAMTMLKDNHVVSAGSISEAVRQAKIVGGFSVKVEVECSSLQQAVEAASAGADIVMLDNFSASDFAQPAKELKSKYPHLLVEMSGGITEENIESYFSPYVDVISLGSLTQGVPAIDFSLKIQPPS
mmetsp:Transcript_56222/g.93521  ORF Transcript_56222/g.93521 Transcript_56222/m.93521 type:complete len:287 (+) Transcript_56222:27-887(+)|eukprot:CAMPEP_0184345278 /NCGR_PEP_ID=MMETSP1089-20130417/13707_1 /TAXON_ID=38269 ORGANISM="Gloeochaete wittrockiana, Strain SAG46.84" /NCGR_SAMPLE_ID=MMETSP1089 /ASSEMBLY_ACC=CAM_ASM_000445 /LENGTH=286 /DNA_ID=CAMNT_0026675517 /DNA_START=22 /DNA_END=882 /DNA_ORIENTATION=-